MNEADAKADQQPVGEAPLVSICICTHNRLSDFAECFGALAPQLQQQPVELIVVDSASDLDAAKQIADIAAAHRDVRLIRLDELGISRARNEAVYQSKGEWIAFLDDDAIPFPDYVDQLVRELKSQRNDVAVVGGRLIGKWPHGERPQGVGPRWAMFLSLIETEHSVDNCESARFSLFAANIAYRRSAMPPKAPFNESLGRVGEKLLSGEEIDLHGRLADSGFRSVYAANVGAWHKVSRTRLTKEWIKSRAYWSGVTEVLICEVHGRKRPAYLNRSKLAASLPILFAMSLIRDPEHDYMIRFHQALGALRGPIA